MADRLSPADAAFLQLEEAEAPQHVGMVAICHDPEGLVDQSRLIGLVRARLAEVPRYRQVVRGIPGRLADPVWVDDAAFDLSYHVRRSALPRPGTDTALRELVARIMSRPLDRSRPLWEMYLVEGLERDRFAILSKAHQALVDGVTTVDLGQLVLSRSSEPVTPTSSADADRWRPAAPPSRVSLVLGAIVDSVLQPTQVVDHARRSVGDTREIAAKIVGAASSLAASARTALRPVAGSPLSVRTSAQRLFATVDTSLEDYRTIRAALGGTVNDVVLATIAGALRTWLQSRGEPVRPGSTIRAIVPVSVHDAGDPDSAPVGSEATSYLVDLPVGEPSPAMRLHQVGYAAQTHQDSGRAVAADVLVRLRGFSPPTLHAVGARVATTLTRRASHLVITNVPGPQEPLFVAGARLLATYPVLLVPRGQAVSIGLTSYDGGVYYGLNADRTAMPDVETLAACISEALAELIASTKSRSASSQGWGTHG
jgi:WS/DGAT/MGAT family acyltransferase